MKVLLDECLPKKLKFDIAAEFVQTVPEAGCASKQNRELLKACRNRVLTCSSPTIRIWSISKPSADSTSLIVLVAPTNDIVDLLPLMEGEHDLRFDQTRNY